MITNAIRSNPAISSYLTLLNQQGSTVELGEVAVVPIDQTLLYVQPVYVESSTNQIPTLKDVVVVYNSTAYQSTNASLDKALCLVTNPDLANTHPFASYCNTDAAKGTSQLPSNTPPTNPAGGTTTTVPTTPTTAPGATTVASLLGKAQSAFAAANAALKSGDLAAYQADFLQAQAYVAQAQQLITKPTTPGR